jgi:hypothetical protein
MVFRYFWSWSVCCLARGWPPDAAVSRLHDHVRCRLLAYRELDDKLGLTDTGADTLADAQRLGVHADPAGSVAVARCIEAPFEVPPAH